MNQINYTFPIFLLLATLNLYAQNDTIINYLDSKSKIIVNGDEKKDFKFIESIIKISDSLWQVKVYRNNGKLYVFRNSKTNDGRLIIGQELRFHINDSLSSITNYNEKGIRDGKTISWFMNKNKNYEGNFLDGNREGLWKFYHYNGVLAAKGFYKRDTLLKVNYFDEKGIEKKIKITCNSDVLVNNKNVNYTEKFSNIDSTLIKSNENYTYTKKDCIKLPYFEGGEKNFIKSVRKMPLNIVSSLQGKLNVNFLIDFDGSIKNVWFSEKLPKYLENKILSFFEKLEGWHPATHFDRKIPYEFHLPINFTNN